jgi:putative sugar O-methyltransferase
MALKHKLGDLAADLLALPLRLGGARTYRFFLDALWTRFPADEFSDAEIRPTLYFPEPRMPDREEFPLVERVFAAFRRAKDAQREWRAELLPASGWQNVMNDAYAPLGSALETGDLDSFHFFLANFLSWKRRTGIENSRLVYECSLDERRKRHFERQIMRSLLIWWARVESQGRDFSALALPDVSNPCGVVVDGHLVSRGSIFSEVYGRMLADLVPGEHPVVAELGGGFGRLLYFMSGNLRRFTYVGFDIPEVLCCASYFLMRTFPEKKFLLHGEADIDSQSFTDYDIVLLPAVEIAKLHNGGVDLFINENSLGAMRAAACRHYVEEICRVAKQFWHRNHEVRRFAFADGTSTMLNREYPVPPERFDLCGRYCDVGSVLGNGRLDLKSDMYCYYYRRRA